MARVTPGFDPTLLVSLWFIILVLRLVVSLSIRLYHTATGFWDSGTKPTTYDQKVRRAAQQDLGSLDTGFTDT